MSMESFGVKKMVEVKDYTVMHSPSVFRNAQLVSHFQAIDIAYPCPNCGTERMTTWLFPDEDMVYQDDCCGITVLFKGVKEV